MSQTTNPTSTVDQTINTVGTIAETVAPAAAALIPGGAAVAADVAAAVPAAEAIAKTVAGDLSSHQRTVTTAIDAASAALASSAPLISTLPAGTQAKVSVFAKLGEELLAELKALF